MIKDVLRDTEGKMKKAIEAIQREFNEVRTGRANPELIENMHFDYYGASTPIKQVAAVSVPDPRMILIQPWDANAIQEIENMIKNSKLGVSPSVDGKVIRIAFPQLSEERRNEMVKVIKDMAERGRISLRTVRRDANERVKKLEDESAITEDDRAKALEEIQKLVDRYIKEVDTILDKKTHELKDV